MESRACIRVPILQDQQLQFNHNSGVAAGSVLTLGTNWNTEGYVDTSGTLQWNKLIKTANATDASSTTGSLTSVSASLAERTSEVCFMLWAMSHLDPPRQASEVVQR